MANAFFCAIFPYLLGLTFLLFLIWALLHLTRPKKDPADPVPAPVEILWLSKACAKALGRCGQPLRLRSMSADNISARLDRYNFGDEIPPTRERYSTWPEQADLICQGKFDELAERQKELREKYGVAGNQPAPANLTASRSAWTALDTLLVFVFICAVLTALCWILTDFLRACAPTPVVDCKTSCPVTPPLPRPTVNLKLSTDQEFEYDVAKVSDSERLEAFLTERLTQFEKTDLTITGYTDPIGGVCHNRKLANDRADAIAAIVRKIIPTARIEQKSVVRSEERKSPADKALVDKCMTAFHWSKPENNRPLREFTVNETNKHKEECQNDPPEEHEYTPNYIWGRCVRGENTEAKEDQECAKGYDFTDPKKIKAVTLGAMKRAAHFYGLLRCLAPLRRVEIKGDDRAAGGVGSGAGK